MATICEIANCNERSYSKNMCRKHYERMRRHGDPHRFDLDFRPANVRVWKYIDKTPNQTGCWLWTGRGRTGRYANFCVRCKNVMAHRFVYELFHGPIQKGLQIDHLCKNTICVNPAHLEAVTPKTNNSRSNSPSAQNAQKTHCKHGHLFSGKNLKINSDGSRECRTCRCLISRRYYERCRKVVPRKYVLKSTWWQERKERRIGGSAIGVTNNNVSSWKLAAGPTHE